MKQQIKFKQTEIGMIPEDWKVKTVGSVCWVKNGKTNSQDAVENGKFPLFDRSPNIKKIDRYLFDCEAVIIPGEGKEFIPRYYEGKFDLHQRAYAISSLEKEKINMRFLYYWIKEKRDYLSRIAVGSTVKSLRLKHLTDFPLGLPSLIEQQSIAKIFFDLDSKIQLNQQVNETLEATSKAIFNRWFLDFEFPDEEGKPYKSTGGEMMDSAMDNIPKKWQVKSFGDVANMSKGMSYSSNEKTKIPSEDVFITLNNISEDGKFKHKYYWIISDRIQEKHFLFEGDLIIANTHFGVGGSNVGRLLGCPAFVIFPHNYKKNSGIFSNDLTKISPLHEEIKYYLYFVLRHTQQDTASRFRTGTSILHLNHNDFIKNKLIVEPPKSILDKFNLIVKPIFVKIGLNHKENTVLVEIRDSLLPKLMTGKIRVPVGVA